MRNLGAGAVAECFENHVDRIVWEARVCILNVHPLARRRQKTMEAVINRRTHSNQTCNPDQ
jgi:hypothetical protein